jgi:DNA-binding GntR family transcriptional regulator
LNETYQYIHEKLIRGELEPGRKLSRRKLAEEIGVSSALVQHALNQLEKMRLVECRPQSGTYVRQLSAEEYDNLCDLRELIEPYAAGRAAERITPTQITILENSCRRFRAANAPVPADASPSEVWRIWGELIDEERVFHGTILSAAGNDLLTSLVQSLGVLAHVRYEIAQTSLAENANQMAIEEHVAILESLRSRKADAARDCMQRHLRNGRDGFKSRLTSTPASPSKE